MANARCREALPAARMCAVRTSRFPAYRLRNNAHRASAFNRQLGTDVLQHMQSGRSLLNPPGTVWHHPVGNPNVVQLMLRSEHTNPLLQPILHPGGRGGWARWR